MWAEIEAADERRRRAALARDRAATHRPITDDEIERLESAGCELRRLRELAGVTQMQLAELADRHPSFIDRIERGARRARLETWSALATALAGLGVGKAADLLSLFTGLAGESVAPASEWPGWSDKLAKRRSKKKLKEQRILAAYQQVWGVDPDEEASE